MKIKWMDRITNEESEKEELCGRGQMMGHTLIHGGLFRVILEGEVGKKRGRP